MGNIEMTQEEFDKDCESICFECASKDDLKVIHPGVALCKTCRDIEEREGY